MDLLEIEELLTDLYSLSPQSPSELNEVNNEIKTALFIEAAKRTDLDLYLANRIFFKALVAAQIIVSNFNDCDISSSNENMLWSALYSHLATAYKYLYDHYEELHDDFTAQYTQTCLWDACQDCKKQLTKCSSQPATASISDDMRQNLLYQIWLLYSAICGKELLAQFLEKQPEMIELWLDFARKRFGKEKIV